MIAVHFLSCASEDVSTLQHAPVWTHPTGVNKSLHVHLCSLIWDPPFARRLFILSVFSLHAVSHAVVSLQCPGRPFWQWEERKKSSRGHLREKSCRREIEREKKKTRSVLLCYIFTTSVRETAHAQWKMSSVTTLKQFLQIRINNIPNKNICRHFLRGKTTPKIKKQTE